MEPRQNLAIALDQSQIVAAVKFWPKVGEVAEIALLKEAFPNPKDAVSIKAMVVNAFYGTNIIAIVKVAECIKEVLKGDSLTGTILVARLVNEIQSITKRKECSFASKYAHFFIDSNCPVLDSYAQWMLAQHLGKTQSKLPGRYESFARDIELLKQLAGLTCSCADLDKYLWVAGEYWWWIKHPNENINRDLLPFLERFSRNQGSEPDLAALLGPTATTQFINNCAI